MKIFISWSGGLSQQLGNAFKDWIPDVLQAVQPYFTPEDIKKGERWGSEIARELEESKFGIFCVTRENLSSGWMNFEAGAISKNKDHSQVCPILFDLQPTDVTGPLQQFQATAFTKDDIYKLLQAINAKLEEQAVSQDRLERQFERVWPQLEEDVRMILATQVKPPHKTPIRKDRELLEEILTLLREMKKSEQSEETLAILREMKNSAQIDNKNPFDKECYAGINIINSYISLVRGIEKGDVNIFNILKELQNMQRYFLEMIPFLQIRRQRKVDLQSQLNSLSFAEPKFWDTPF